MVTCGEYNILIYGIGFILHPIFQNLSQLCYSKGGKGYLLNAKSWAETCIAKDLSESSPLRAKGKIGEIINWFENREPYNELHAVLGLVDIW